MNFQNAPEELRMGLTEIANFIDLDIDAPVVFEKADGMSLCERDGNIVIGYNEKRDAFRAVSMLGTFIKDRKPIAQKPKFERLCLMADCSRNAVVNLPALKELMVRLALMGYNAMMLYTEDTYQIPEYPYFGHLRGRYTVAEMKEINAYGKALGLEIIPCIQTLAHLNAIKDWGCFTPYMDIDDILLVGDERTYKLIEQMFITLKECFDSPYIHIGMDEAHHIGRGKYTDVNGYAPKAEVMLKHLDRVMALCKKYDYQPVIWSDMFYRMQFNGVYQVKEGELSREVTDKIPEGLALCYWNYYNNAPLLDHMFATHQKIGNPVWFAGGAWSWSGVTPKNGFSCSVTPTQLKYAEQYGVQSIIATAWGDDGAECAIFSILPALLQYAEICYDNLDDINARAEQCFGLSFDEFIKIDAVGDVRGLIENTTNPPCVEKAVLYNDILLGKYNWELAQVPFGDKYAKDAETLAAVPAGHFSFLFKTQEAYARLLDKKLGLPRKIKLAYKAGDKAALKAFADTDIPEVIELLDAYILALRTQWLTVNKPFGFEIQDLRLGGMKERLISAAARLRAYADGRLEQIDELEEDDLPISCNPDKPNHHLNSWRKIFSPSVTSHQ